MKEQPNEKSRELVEKFLQFTPAEEEFEFEYAKQCALISCDFTIDELKQSNSIWASYKIDEIQSLKQSINDL